jgi:hypothetical protein
MKLLLKSLALFAGMAFASPALAFSQSCADWKDPDLRSDFWKGATRAIIADCVQDMGFAMGFSVKDQNDDGATPLHLAAWNTPSPDVISALLQAGADMKVRNKYGQTPMHYAGWNYNPDVITALLEAGADLNARDAKGMTPLHEAARTNLNPDAIKALLEAGADGSLKNANGKTPFDLANVNAAIKNTDAYWALNDARFK